jgi:hypothetical protein
MGDPKDTPLPPRANKKVSFLIFSTCRYSFSLGLDWCYHWLNTARTDGKPRVLIISTPKRIPIPPTDIYEFIDRIQQVFFSLQVSCERKIKKNVVFQDFLMAQQSIGFFIRLKISCDLWKELELENILILANHQTNEKLTIKLTELNASGFCEKMLLISRHPRNATKEWIETKEKEILGWTFHEQNRQIRLSPI